MIPGMACFANVGTNKGSSLREVINELGLTSGLKVLLDAGDIASVASGSQTKWLDISGNGYDFNRGSGSGSDSADPTFNGVVGRQSSGEFYSSDGGDYFTYDSANETWMNNLHKDNARFSVAAWVNLPNTPDNQYILSTDNGGGPGIYLLADNGHAFLGVLGSALAFASDNVIVVGGAGWAFVGLSVNEPGNSCIWNVRGTPSSGTCTYSAPSSASASDTMRIGYRAGGVLSNGSRIANLAVWEGTSLTAAQLAAMFTATRGKFGV
jgi:hypothetical protein